VTDSIHLALAFDDNFWAPAYATMRSVCISTTRRKDLVFHLLHFPLTAPHRADLEKIESEYGATLVWHDLSQSQAFADFVAELPSSAQWPKIVYGRMLMGRILPESVQRLIYLDCDVLVRRPIEALYTADLDGKPLGAVLDCWAPFIPARKEMRQNLDIFETGEPYFNSGVLLMDMAQWRQIDMQKEIQAIAQKGILQRLFYDQDVLNLVFRNRWHELEWRWNTMNAHFAHEGLGASILHYTGNKPWGILSGILRSTAYARWYRHVMTNEIFYAFARHRWQRWWKKTLRIKS
jgi:lipopolysaccharide biosynthesis glycosyltransferase